MKTARVSLCLATVLSWALTSPTMAQQLMPPGQYPGQAVLEDSTPLEGTDDMQTRSLFDNRNYMLRSDAGDGVGYLRGYQTFAAWQPIIVTPDELMFWVSPRGYITYNSGNFAGNLGAGARWLNPENQRILGGGVWWDHDNNGANQYDQIGGSFESLGNFLDFRTNVYIPTNQNTHFVSQFFNSSNMFIGHNIGIGQTTITNSSLRGGDFESGGALPYIGDLGLRAYGGGYYYQGPDSGGGIYGIRGRLEALVTQNLWGTVIVTHDRVFGTNVSAAATIYLGTGQSSKFMQRISMQNRLYQQQERQYRVAVQQDVENQFLLAMRNGGTGGSGGGVGTAIFVDHVNNTAAAGGDGSAEHPFNHLPTTTPSNVDIVFVNRGDGTSNNMNQGITLNNFQRLLGDGIVHQFTSTLGTFTLPGFTPGAFPTITNINPGGSAVTLASHNEVSGFNITNSALNGITGSGITNFNINNVNITNSGNSLGATPVGAGILLTNATGVGQIFNANFNNNNAEGIRIDNTAGGVLALAVTNVQANGNLTGLELNANASEIDPTVSNLTASNNKHDGIAISLANGSTMNGSFDLIRADNNNNPLTPALSTFGNGFTYTSDNSAGNITIQRGEFAANGLNGLNFTTTDNSTLTALLRDNNNANGGRGISNNLQDGVLFTNTNSQVTARLLNNIINTNGGFGVGVTSKGTGAFPTSFDLVAGGYQTQDINGNGLLDPGENNVAISSLGPTIIGNGVLNREGNTIIGNHGAGIAYTLLDQGTGTANIIGNIIQSTAAANPVSTTYLGQAIDIRVTGSNIASNSTASFTGGTIDANLIGSLTTASLGNAGGGIRVLADQNTSLQALNIGTALQGNIIAHNANDGINIQRNNTAQVGNITPVVINNNQIEFNTGNGTSITARNSFGNVVNGFMISNNKILNNTSNGVALALEADANMDVNIHANTIMNNATNGILTTETIGSPGDLRGLGGTWDQNTITFNGVGTAGDGIQLNAAMGTPLQTLLIGSTTSAAGGNTISNNGGHGILINSAGFLTAGFNTIDSNALGGIYMHGRTQNNVVINRNVITNNGTVSATADGGDGIQVVNAGLTTASDIVTITNNTIRGNAGRGLNVLNQANGQLTVDAESNTIKSNLLEGVYVVNTASGTQSADVLSSAAMAADGSVFAVPHMVFTFNNNDVEGNGIGLSGTSVASGLVMRVGSSDSSGNFHDDGGFASEGRGGIVATVTNNLFHGNLGDDLSFSSYVSSIPTTPAGTWNATTFTLPVYQNDPLSRLDLSFHNNVFDSTPTNVGNVPGAFYADADGVFKSRLNTATDPGPFGSATRQRNAERLAARFGLPPATPGGQSNLFLYPGLGQSTFRLLDASSGGLTTLTDVTNAGFITDLAPYTGPGSARGSFNPGSTYLPFGWTFYNGTAQPARPQ